MLIIYRNALQALAISVGVFVLPEVRLMAQGIDAQTMDTLRLLLDTNVIQLIMVVMVLMAVAVLAIVVMLWRRGGSQERLNYRLLDVLEKTNATSEKRDDALDKLQEAIAVNTITQQQAVERHIANSGFIAEGARATQALAATIDLLNKNMVNWSKLLDDGMSSVRSELVRLVNEFLKFREQQDTVIQQMNEEQRKAFELVIRDGNILILAKLDEILNRLPPPTEPDSAPKAPNVTPLNADGAAHSATVDLPVVKSASEESAA